MRAHQYLPKNESWESDVCQAPADLPTPFWLVEGNYESPRWSVIDDHPSSPKPAKSIRWNIQIFDPRRRNELCRLTDPQYSNLLETIRHQSYCMRVGKFASCTSAVGHADATRQSMNWAVWMIRNSIYRFADLDPDDFEAYTQSARYGSTCLLGYKERLVEYVAELKSSGRTLPTIRRSGMDVALDSYRLLTDAGLDPNKARPDQATTYELARMSKSAGLYLTQTQIRRLSKGMPSPRQLCSVSLSLLLYPWEQQWHMREELRGDRLTFDPFLDCSANEVSIRFGNTVSRTRTAPVKQTMELIDRSIRWVVDYATPLLDLRDTYLEVAGRNLAKERRLALMAANLPNVVMPEGPGRPYPLRASSKSTSAGLGVGVAINRFIPTACAVVISAFTARRHEEVLTIRAAGPDNDHCLSQDVDGFWLEVFIEKRHQNWIKTPCNELVAKAVEVLERWSSPARSQSGKPAMFQLRRILSLPVVRFSLRNSLKEFVDFLQLSSMADGTHWKFTPHQFRRFFAITYYWRYEYGSLSALSQHLFHTDPQMTLRYVTEGNQGAIFSELGAEHTTTLLTETSTGARNLSGPYGERFKATAAKLYRRYKRSAKLVVPALVRRTVARYVEKSSIRLKAMPWGYCTCGNTPRDTMKARCVKEDLRKEVGGPDLSSSSPIVCCDCPHHATEKPFEPFLLTQIELHRRAAADSQNGAMLRAISKDHVKKLRAHHSRCFLKAAPLECSSE